MGCGGCASAGERCGNGLEKIYPTTAVRFGKMRHIGEFSHPHDMKFSCGAKVVIASDRGIEIGSQVSLTCFGCDKSVNRDQMRAYAEASGGDAYRFKSGRILREATETDLSEWKHIEDAAFDKLQTCRRFSNELDLPMKIVDCEHTFGGERIIYYFMSEERVDFRDLVHQLASEYQTRIEMRQVGARDEARLVADYETCGRECCCKSFLKTLKPISMSMAKIQKTTLDLSKVSGRCGRAKCCLRYEHEGYESLDKKLPRMGSRIRTAHGVGQVIDRQILTQLVKIRQDDGKLLSVVVEDIQETNLPAPPVQPGADMADEGPRRGRQRWPSARPDAPPPEQKPPADLVEEDWSPPAADDAADVDQNQQQPDQNPGTETTGPVDQNPQNRPSSRRRRRRGRSRGPDRPDGGTAPRGPQDNP